MAGIAIGAVLFGGGAAYAAGLLAEPSTQTFYLGDQQIELEAYAINGHNYVKLRDVGQAVDFNVCYNPTQNAAIIEPDKPYTGEDVTTATPAPSAQPSESADYAAQANPTIFTGDLTREVYNGIRSTLENLEAVANGAAEPANFTAENEQVENVLAAMGQYPKYALVSEGGGKYACAVKYLDVYAPAVEHTQPFVDSLDGLNDRDKVERIVWYVCDRLTYAIEYPFVDEVLSQDGEVSGCCMAYAYSFQFLCDRAGIPCVLASSDIHQWNKVYVDGQWWDVDVTGDDVPDPTLRSKVTVLHPQGERDTGIYEDTAPEVTAFAMDLLVPGSTK